MPPDYAVETGEGEMRFRCGGCGWSGSESDIETWAIQAEFDRAVRCCPDCGDPVLEWGALRGLDGLQRIARGLIREALAEEGLITE